MTLFSKVRSLSSCTITCHYFRSILPPFLHIFTLRKKLIISSVFVLHFVVSRHFIKPLFFSHGPYYLIFILQLVLFTANFCSALLISGSHQLLALVFKHRKKSNLSESCMESMRYYFSMIMRDGKYEIMI